MRNSLNTRARLHRAMRNNHTITTVWETFRTFKWFTLAMITLLPIYPSLTVLGSNLDTQVGDYDNSTIITAYDESNPETGSRIAFSENGMIQTQDDGGGVTSTTTKKVPQDIGTIDTSRTSREVAVDEQATFYTIKKGDTVAKIASKYKINTDALLWANDMTEDDDIIAGESLRIPPTAGFVYAVKRGDTLSTIAAKYHVSSDAIMSANKLTSAQSLRAGKSILLPGVTPPAQIHVIAKTTPPVTKKTQTVTKKASSTPVAGLKDRYTIQSGGSIKGFAWGNCTAYVASHKNVTWRGNANQWIKNARAQGVPTGSTPIPGAIIQFSGSGYNRYYGHVGIVVDVTDDSLVVKDMNYRRLNEVTVRKIPRNHPSIDGYIYVD